MKALTPYKFGDALKRFIAQNPEALEDSTRFAHGSAVVIWEQSLRLATESSLDATKVA